MTCVALRVAAIVVAAQASAPAGVDVFGTRTLYPDASGGREWHARWAPMARVLATGDVDPIDPEFDVRGSRTKVEIRGDGTAKISGDAVRLYVGDRSKARRWLNVELTVYGKLSDRQDPGGRAGFAFETRTDDGHTSAARKNAAGLPVQCDAHAYAFSFRADGSASLEKELKHPFYTRELRTSAWNGAPFPRNRWIGMKMVVYNVDGGRHVKQELWRDISGGVDGGTWEKVLEHTDDGGWSIDADIAGSCGIPPDLVVNTPQPFIIVRAEHATEQWYRSLSVREIEPPTR